MHRIVVTQSSCHPLTHSNIIIHLSMRHASYTSVLGDKNTKQHVPPRYAEHGMTSPGGVLFQTPSVRLLNVMRYKLQGLRY